MKILALTLSWSVLLPAMGSIQGAVLVACRRARSDGVGQRGVAACAVQLEAELLILSHWSYEASGASGLWNLKDACAQSWDHWPMRLCSPMVWVLYDTRIARAVIPIDAQVGQTRPISDNQEKRNVLAVVATYNFLEG